MPRVLKMCIFNNRMVMWHYVKKNQGDLEYPGNVQCNEGLRIISIVWKTPLSDSMPMLQLHVFILEFCYWSLCYILQPLLKIEPYLPWSTEFLGTNKPSIHIVLLIWSVHFLSMYCEVSFLKQLNRFQLSTRIFWLWVAHHRIFKYLLGQ